MGIRDRATTREAAATCPTPAFSDGRASASLAMRPGHGIARAGCDAMGFPMTESRLDLSRTAIYARYSSPRQKPTSIDDQLRDCLRYVSSHSGKVHAEYSDARQSGGTSFYFRTGFQSLINDCRVGHFSAVCADSL
ncbi:MAG: recombinase family protein, partial [Alphaproteobacteria bacterium]|nr:recombinase family protein [Alphaproteobacteria bacterium]